MKSSIDFFKITPHQGSQDKGFEEMVCQLAKSEFERRGEFCRVKGSGGDGGLEAYVRLPNGVKYCWQAKYYPDGKLTPRRKAQILDSLTTTRGIHPECTKWYLAIPTALSDKTARRGTTDRQWWNSLCAEYAASGVTLLLWDETELIDRLTQEKNRGRLLYWFGTKTLPPDWFASVFQKRMAQLGDKYVQALHVPGPLDTRLLCCSRGPDRLTQVLTMADDDLRGIQDALGLLGREGPISLRLKVTALGWAWDRTDAVLRMLVTILNAQYVGRPLTLQETTLVKEMIRVEQGHFERAAWRAMTLRRRLRECVLAFEHRQSVNDAEPVSAVDVGLKALLQERQDIADKMNDVLQSCSGGLDAFHLTETRHDAQGERETHVEIASGGGGSDSESAAGAAIDSYAPIVDGAEYSNNPEYRDIIDEAAGELLSDLDDDTFYAMVDSQSHDDDIEDTDELGGLVTYAAGEVTASGTDSIATLHLDECVYKYLGAVKMAFTHINGAFESPTKVIRILAPPGTGKTHLFADITRCLVNDGHPALLLTGDLFSGDRSVEASILDILGLQGLSWEDFFPILEVAAETAGSKALILIDGINETPSYRLWKTWLPSFERQFFESDHVALAISCRSNYVDLIWPSDLPQEGTVALTHSDEALSLMLERYLRVFRLRVRYDSPEEYSPFRHPLYLRLFCRIYGDPERTKVKEVVVGLESIFDVFEQYLSVAASSIADRAGQDPRDVSKFLVHVGELFWSSDTRYLPWDTLSTAVNRMFGPQISLDTSITRSVLSEELLLRRDLEDAKDVAVFSYDLLGDYIVGYYGMLHQQAWSGAILDSIPWHQLHDHPRGPGIIDFLSLAIPRHVSGQQLWEVAPRSEAYIRASLKALSSVAPSTVRPKDLAFVLSLLNDGQHVNRAMRVLFSWMLYPGYPLDLTVFTDAVDAIGTSTWQRWVRSNTDLLDRWRAKFIRRPTWELFNVGWLVYQVFRDRTLIAYLVDFVG